MRCSHLSTAHGFNELFRDRWHFNADVGPETCGCP